MKEGGREREKERERGGRERGKERGRRDRSYLLRKDTQQILLILVKPRPDLLTNERDLKHYIMGKVLYNIDTLLGSGLDF